MSTTNSLADTLIRRIAAGSKTIGSGATKYLHIDSGTEGAEIIGIAVKGIVGADWTVDLYIPAEDGAAACAAADKRDSVEYNSGDSEGGHLGPFAVPYDMYLDFTNDSGGSDDIDEVLILYRSSAALTLTWET